MKPIIILIRVILALLHYGLITAVFYLSLWKLMWYIEKKISKQLKKYFPITEVNVISGIIFFVCYIIALCFLIYNVVDYLIIIYILIFWQDD